MSVRTKQSPVDRLTSIRPRNRPRQFPIICPRHPIDQPGRRGIAGGIGNAPCPAGDDQGLLIAKNIRADFLESLKEDGLVGDGIAIGGGSDGGRGNQIGHALKLADVGEVAGEVSTGAGKATFQWYKVAGMDWGGSEGGTPQHAKADKREQQEEPVKLGVASLVEHGAVSFLLQNHSLGKPGVNFYTDRKEHGIEG